MDLYLLACGDVFPDRLRCSLHGLGSDRQIGQELQLLSPVMKSTEFGDLPFRFAQGGLRGKILGDGFPLDLPV